jgi:hypothetical protein
MGKLVQLNLSGANPPTYNVSGGAGRATSAFELAPPPPPPCNYFCRADDLDGVEAALEDFEDRLQVAAHLDGQVRAEEVSQPIIGSTTFPTNDDSTLIIQDTSGQVSENFTLSHDPASLFSIRERSSEQGLEE